MMNNVNTLCRRRQEEKLETTIPGVALDGNHIGNIVQPHPVKFQGLKFLRLGGHIFAVAD